MKFSYRLKRVCGSVYSNGNLAFTPDGNSVISPVGNRLNVFDLINQTSDALPIENRKNIKLIAVSHNGRFLVSIDVDGNALFYNFPHRTLLHRFNFRQKVYDLKFSPDDRYFAVTYGRGIQIWQTPSAVREFCPLTLNRTIQGHFDDTTCLDWSSDSRSIIIGSKDLSCRVYFRVTSKLMAMSVLSGHRDELVGVYFGGDPNEAYTVAADGAVFCWKYEANSNPASKKKRKSGVEGEDEAVDSDDESSEEDSDDSGDDLEQSETKQLKVVDKAGQRKGSWQLTERQLLRDHQGDVTCTAFNKQASILVLGFANGVFGLYEMPGCTNIHRLSVSNSAINAISINPTGEWLAIGAADVGQLLVWEWKSETYVLKQQGHLYGLNTLDFSPEGQFIATGGEDGKVKVWNALSGFCVVTFKEHIAPVTGVKFIGQGQGKAVLSSSLDGTVRAHDLLRYKNFRTLTSPTPVQFTCLAADPTGEIVCAGTLDPFNIYVWALQTGKLLEILAGHEGPIACLDFSPATSMLASGSWDGTMKLWDVYKNSCVETFEHGCDVLAVTFRPDGKEVCCGATNGNIYFWDVENGEQVGIIEGRRDITGGRLTTDAASAENSARSKFFTSLAYSADGTCILAGGRSKYICIYAVVGGVLVKKFQLSSNRSLEGIVDKLRSDNLVDGVVLDNLNVDDGENETKRSAGGKKLPGAGSSSLNDGSRTTKPELLTSALKFSPTGREYAVASTQGLQIFGLDEAILFAPIELDIAITPQAIATAVVNQEYAKAITMALHLGEYNVLKGAIEAVSIENIELVIKTVDVRMLKELLKYLAQEMSTSPKLELYLRWTLAVLQTHGPYIQSAANMSLQESLRSILRALTSHEKDIFKVTTDNMFTVNFILSQLDESRDDPLNTDELEVLEEVELGDGEVVEGGEGFGGEWATDATAWSTAWEDSEEVASSEQVQDIISNAVSHFTGGGAMDVVDAEEESKEATTTPNKSNLSKGKKVKETKTKPVQVDSDGDSDGKSKKSRRVSFSKKLEAVKIIS